VVITSELIETISNGAYDRPLLGDAVRAPNGARTAVHAASSDYYFF